MVTLTDRLVTRRQTDSDTQTDRQTDSDRQTPVGGAGEWHVPVCRQTDSDRVTTDATVTVTVSDWQTETDLERDRQTDI